MHDDPRRHRLDPAGGQVRTDLLPQHRRHLVAVEPIEDAPRLLGVDQVVVQLTRGVGGGPDGGRRDLVEDHPLDRHLRLQGVQQVPGDRLALAILVRGQIQLVRPGQQRLQLRDLGPLLGRHDVDGLEVVLRVHAEPGPRFALVLGRDVGGIARQVTDVTHRRLDDVSVAEILRNGLRLGRRLDDDQADTGMARSFTCGHLVHVLLYIADRLVRPVRLDP